MALAGKRLKLFIGIGIGIVALAFLVSYPRIFRQPRNRIYRDNRRDGGG